MNINNIILWSVLWTTLLECIFHTICASQNIYWREIESNWKKNIMTLNSLAVTN